MKGTELRKLAEAAGLGPIDVCQESGIRSPTTVHKVYNDERVRQRTKVQIEQAIRRLAAKAKAIAV